MEELSLMLGGWLILYMLHPSPLYLTLMLLMMEHIRMVSVFSINKNRITLWDQLYKAAIWTD